jgi:hypothetical protein
MTNDERNREQADRALMIALAGIADGKVHTEWVGTFGASVRIFDALKGALNLPEPFHADHMHLVDRAFEKRGLRRTSDRKDLVAGALLAHFVPPNA